MKYFHERSDVVKMLKARVLETASKEVVDAYQDAINLLTAGEDKTRQHHFKKVA